MSARVFSVIKADAPTLDIYLKVTPKAYSDALGQVERMADGSLRLSVKVRAAGDKGTANAAVIKVIAKAFDLPKSALSIRRGETSRLKTLSAPDSDALRSQLEALI